MIRGVWRATRRRGEFGLAGSCVIPVPIWLVVIFAMTSNLPFFSIMVTTVEIDPPPLDVLEFGGLSIRTARLCCWVALTLYLAVWTVPLLRASRHRGACSRLMRGQGLACAGVLVFCLISTWAVAAKPSRADWLRAVERDLSHGSCRSLAGAVLNEQRDVAPLAREALGSPRLDVRLASAASLWRFGDRRDEVREAIRTGMGQAEQSIRTTRSCPEEFREAVVIAAWMLLDNRPVPDGWQDSSCEDRLPGGAYFWGWWARYREDFD